MIRDIEKYSYGIFDVDKVSVKTLADYRLTVVWLMDQGCVPNLYKRSKNEYRFHVNRYGNFWEDDSDRCKACERAVNNWIEAGMPKEG